MAKTIFRKFYYILVVFVVSCNFSPQIEIKTASENNIETIDCDIAIESALLQSNSSIDDLIDTMYVIKLQTDDNSVVSYIKNLLITSDFIYIIDDLKNVTIFNIDGSFVRKLPQGQAPGELSSAINIAYNKNIGRFCVFQDGLCNIYDASGGFIQNIGFPYIQEAIGHEQGYLVVRFAYGTEFGDYHLLRVDSDCCLLENIGLTGTYPFYKSPVTISYSQDRGVYISRTFDNLIYLYDGDSLSVKYKLSLSINKLEVEEDNGMFNYLKYKNITNKFYFGGSFFENEEFQCFEFASSDNRCMIYRNKNTGKFRSGLGKEIIKDSNIGSMISRSDIYGVLDGYFYNYLWYSEEAAIKANNLTAGKQISQEDVDKIKNLKEDDNPLLILYKLKGLD